MILVVVHTIKANITESDLHQRIKMCVCVLAAALRKTALLTLFFGLEMCMAFYSLFSTIFFSLFFIYDAMRECEIHIVNIQEKQHGKEKN